MACFPLVAYEGHREEWAMELSHKGWQRERKWSGSGVVGVGHHREQHSLGVVGMTVCRME